MDMIGVVVLLLVAVASADEKGEYDPFGKLKSGKVKFERDYRLDCKVSTHNFKKVSWVLNEKDFCYGDTPWCSLSTMTNSTVDGIYHYSSLKVWSVIRNGTYTCRGYTNDNRYWVVSETKLEVVPKYESTTNKEVGSDDTIYCDIRTPGLEALLLRDGKEFCTNNSDWCLQRNGTRGSGMFFDVLDLTENHTYTCEAYNYTGSKEERLATVSVHHIFVYFENETTTEAARLATASENVTDTSSPSGAPSTDPTGTTAQRPFVPQGGPVFIKANNIGNIFVFPLKRQD